MKDLKLEQGISAMNEDIIRQIKSLPPMPDAVRQIQIICNNPSSSV